MALPLAIRASANLSRKWSSARSHMSRRDGRCSFLEASAAASASEDHAASSSSQLSMASQTSAAATLRKLSMCCRAIWSHLAELALATNLSRL